MNSNGLNSARPALRQAERARAHAGGLAPRPLGIWVTSKEPQGTIHVFHWQSHIGPHTSISSQLKVLDRAPVEHLAVIACTHRRWRAPVVSSTLASSSTLPEHIHGLNLTGLPLIYVCPRQPLNKRSGEPILVYSSRSHSIQGFRTNKWPTRTTVLAQTWTETTRNG
jgi:hypothetical protein